MHKECVMQDMKVTRLVQQSIGPESARSLSTTNNTPPIMPLTTPRWLMKCLPWIDIESGTYRINRVKVFSDIHRLSLNKDNTLTSQILADTPLFCKMPYQALEEIIAKLQYRKFAEGELIMKIGDAAHFFIIIDGKVDLSTLNQAGELVLVRSLCEGDYFGHISLLENTPSQMSAYALTDTEVIVLEKKTFNKILDNVEAKANIIEHFNEYRMDLQRAKTAAGDTFLQASYSGENKVTSSYSDYEESQEIHLSMLQTTVGINSHINEIYNVPYNQLEQQLHLTIENILEHEEWEVINNSNFGLIHNVVSNMKIKSRAQRPTPDSMDDLISLVWKSPSFFLAHPRAIAAFGRECTAHGVPPVVIEMYGAKFLTWRGIPFMPSDKMQIHYKDGYPTTDILLMRTGEAERGVVGLHKANISNHGIPSLAVQFMGINECSIAKYLVTKYFSAAVLVPDALGMLTNVKISHYSNI